MSDNGWWAVAETPQMRWLPNALHGPYWDRSEAAEVASALTDVVRAAGRHDRFDVVRLEIANGDDE